MTLIATWRSSSGSRPRYTCPMPPVPIWRMTSKMPIFSGMAATLHRLDQDCGGVVGAAASIGLGNHRFADVVERTAIRHHQRGDFAVGEHAVDPVGTDHQPVAWLEIEFEDIHRHPRLTRYRAGDDMAQRVRARRLRINQSLRQLFGDDR